MDVARHIAQHIDKSTTKLFALQTLSSSNNTLERKMLKSLGFQVTVTKKDYPELADPKKIPEDPSYVCTMYVSLCVYVLMSVCFRSCICSCVGL
jgi:hypothetical protein